MSDPRKSALQGQAFAEYAILIGIIITALLGMQAYAKRGIQSVVREAADEMSPFRNDAVGDPNGERAQVAGMEYEAGGRPDQVQTAKPGNILARESAVATDSAQTMVQHPVQGGGHVTQVVSDTTTTGGALANRGGAASYQEVLVELNTK